jgi:hypothetical protein
MLLGGLSRRLDFPLGPRRMGKLLLLNGGLVVISGY